MGGSIRIALWNIEWAPRTSARGVEIRRQLDEAAPDIICLTEANASFLMGGHQIEADADYGYPVRADRRKVLLWSRWPWHSSDKNGGHGLPPGRYIEGKVGTPLGEIRLIGVCIPWAHAHVSSGARDRVPWADHMAYLEGLSEVVGNVHGKAIVLGDFNQTIPRLRQPLQVANALSASLSSRLIVATGDLVDANGTMAIDHLAHTPDLSAKVTSVLPAMTPQSLRLSDHFGMVLDVKEAG